jgi:hypothetical protein
MKRVRQVSYLQADQSQVELFKPGHAVDAAWYKYAMHKEHREVDNLMRQIEDARAEAEIKKEVAEMCKETAKNADQEAAFLTEIRKSLQVRSIRIRLTVA